MASRVEIAFLVLLVAIGAPHAIWPYRLSRFNERWDSIGSKRSWHEVEPADWNVELTRVLGLLFTGLGVGGLVVVAVS